MGLEERRTIKPFALREKVVCRPTLCVGASKPVEGREAQFDLDQLQGFRRQFRKKQTNTNQH